MQGVGLAVMEELILEDLRQEVERNGHRLIQLRAVREAADAQTRGFLDRVLRERLDQSFRRIFHRLALADPSGRARQDEHPTARCSCTPVSLSRRATLGRHHA